MYEKSNVPEMRAKGTGLLIQMKSFEFIFGLVMMQPILQMILKVSKVLQVNNLELLTKILQFYIKIYDVRYYALF